MSYKMLQKEKDYLSMLIRKTLNIVWVSAVVSLLYNYISVLPDLTYFEMLALITGGQLIKTLYKY